MNDNLCTYAVERQIWLIVRRLKERYRVIDRDRDRDRYKEKEKERDRERHCVYEYIAYISQMFAVYVRVDHKHIFFSLFFPMSVQGDDTSVVEGFSIYLFISTMTGCIKFFITLG